MRHLIYDVFDTQTGHTYFHIPTRWLARLVSGWITGSDYAPMGEGWLS